MSNSRRARSGKSNSKKGEKKTSGYVSVLEVKEGEKGDYIQFTKNPNVEILVNGVNVNGKSVYLNDPAEKFDRFVESGNMTEEEAEEAVAKIPSYVIEEGVLKLD